MHEELLTFISPELSPCRVLAIDCAALLPAILQQLPQAELLAIGRAPGETDSRICWQEAVLQELSFAKESFAYIVAPQVFTQEAEAALLVQRFYQWLSPKGALLTGFKNVRHWRVLQDLMAGHFHCGEAEPGQNLLRFFALPEIVRFFECHHYRELRFLSKEEPSGTGAEQALERAGFVNPEQDISTVYWYVRARRSTEAAGFLKTQFDRELRQELVYLLRRVEYGIAPEENVARLMALCGQNHVPMDYLAKLASNALAAPKKALRCVAAIWASEEQR